MATHFLLGDKFRQAMRDASAGSGGQLTLDTRRQVDDMNFAATTIAWSENARNVAAVRRKTWIERVTAEGGMLNV